MAKAKVVEKTKKPKRVVRLTLTVAEAQTLVDVTTRIGGHNEDSPRVHTEAVLKALRGAGVFGPGHRTSDPNRAIYFYNFDGFNHTDWGF
jgi:hypothetical protein